MSIEAMRRRSDRVRRRSVVLGSLVALAGAGCDAGDEGAVASLVGTEWRLESLAGDGVVPDAVPTLAFPEQARVTGEGSCNGFSGDVVIDGSAIRFGPLVATRMACGDEVDEQERRYFAALEAAERYELDGTELLIHSAGTELPLRFAAARDAPATGEGTRGEAPRAALPEVLMGVWTVTGHWLASAAALDEDEAASWHGRDLRLLGWEARSPGHRCPAPSYRTEDLAADAFVSRFDSWPQGLVLPVASGRVRIMSVLCDGSDWVAPGGMLIRVTDDSALTVWDGAFFALARDREAEDIDFRAQGNEPGWLLEIVEGERIRFEYDYGADEAITPAPDAEVDAATGAVAYHAVTEANDLRVEIRPEPCRDDMSGFPYPAAVTVTLGDRVFFGCGGPRPPL